MLFECWFSDRKDLPIQAEAFRSVSREYRLHSIDMSENQPLPNSSDSPSVDSTDNANSAQGTYRSDADPSTSAQTDDWEIVAAPGTVDSVQLSANFERTVSGCEAVDESALSEPVASGREGELLALIHDLNQCNDVLLSRVTQLEGALEKSQAAQISHSAQQQIAQLVNKLDNTEQALSRQLLINENLQTEVNNCQERISQLDRECAMGAQRHLEEVQARAKAEADSKDLRSRLQRQQRYTMQFKAALEKSLTVTARPRDAAVSPPLAFKDSSAVVMPKAQRIMPWVSDNSSPFAGIDPHLESLIRGVGKSDAQAEAARAIAQRDSSRDSSAPTSLENATPSEAEAKLWQDLERVISHTERRDGAEVAGKTVDIAADGRLDDLVDDTPVILSEQSDRTVGLEITSQTDSEKVNTDPLPVKKSSGEDDLIHQIENSFAAANRNAPEVLIGFTEPSPWEKPLSEEQSEKQPEEQLDKKLGKLADGAKAQPVSSGAEDSYLPASDDPADPAATAVRSGRSPRPVSLSNVKLPTFRNAKVASFRR